MSCGRVKIDVEIHANAYATMMKALRFWGGSAKQVADEIEFQRKAKAIVNKAQQSKQSLARKIAR